MTAVGRTETDGRIANQHDAPHNEESITDYEKPIFYCSFWCCTFYRRPLCGQRAIGNEDWAHGLYTRMPERVTSRKCLKSLARKERLASETAQLEIANDAGDL